MTWLPSPLTSGSRIRLGFGTSLIKARCRDSAINSLSFFPRNAALALTRWNKSSGRSTVVRIKAYLHGNKLRARFGRMTENAPKTGRFGALLSLAVNITVPLIVYHCAAPHLGEGGGLVLSSVPVILWNLLEIVHFRRLDAVSLLVLLGILLSLGAMVVGGSARFLLLRESLVTGMIGMVFLGSLLFPRPLMYYLARSGEAKRSAEDLSVFETAWPKPRFVRAMYLMTWVWGLGLVFEAVLRCWLVWSWPVERFLAIAPVIGYGIYFSLLGWSLWYRSRLKAAGRKREP
jgi:hypothetical protein